MTVRALTSTGDIATSGRQFVGGQEEIAQTIKTRLGLFLGEYFRDIHDGTDWFGKILGKGQGQQAAEATIRRRIFQTSGVLSIASFSTTFDQAGRVLTISCSVLTRFGQSSITVTSGV